MCVFNEYLLRLDGCFGRIARNSAVYQKIGIMDATEEVSHRSRHDANSRLPRYKIAWLGLLLKAIAVSTSVQAECGGDMPAMARLIGPSADTINLTNGYPDATASAQLYDAMDYQRAVQAYIWAVPLVNSIALKKGLISAGASAEKPSMVIFNRRLTAKQKILTGSSEVIYGISVFDLGTTGPLQIEVPDGILGTIVDVWMRGLEDVGVGPTGGGTFILAPKDYNEAVSPHVRVVRSKTRNVFFLARGIIQPDGDLTSGVNQLSSIKIRSVGADADEKLIVLNGDREFCSIAPAGEEYFAYLSEGIQSESISAEDKMMMAMLKPLGIFPGVDFRPNDRVASILSAAATTGSAMVANLAYANRNVSARFWPERQWERVVTTTSPDFISDTMIELDERAAGWHQIIMNPLYLYKSVEPGQGSFYVAAYKDQAGRYLDGSKNYKIKVPKNVPVAGYWSFTIYDSRTRSQVLNASKKAYISSNGNIQRNPDGSIDILFTPKIENFDLINVLQTQPGKGYFVMFRAFGPLEGILSKRWILPDIEEL